MSTVACNSPGKHTSIVGIVQFRNSFDPGVFHRRTLLVELCLSFEVDPVQDALYYAATNYLEWKALSLGTSLKHAICICLLRQSESTLHPSYGWKPSPTPSMPLTAHTPLINFSLSLQVEPKLFAWSVIFSFVWESNVGFSIRAFMKIQIWFFT